MAAPPKVTEEAKAEISAVALARDRIPTDKALRTKHHISQSRLHQIMKAARAKLDKHLTSDVPRGTDQTVAVGSNFLTGDPR